MGDGIKLSIKALDVSGFRDEQVTFMLMTGEPRLRRWVAAA